MKTYSVVIKSAKTGFWITNWGQFMSADDINWEKVDNYVTSKGDLGYGFVYGRNSRDITSPANRTVLWEAENN